MQKMTPVSALTWNQDLAKAAEFHTIDTGSKGLYGHWSSDGTSQRNRLERYAPNKSTGENISYGSYNKDIAKRVILQLLVDDGNSSRGQRTNLFSERWNAYGGFTGTHKE